MMKNCKSKVFKLVMIMLLLTNYLYAQSTNTSSKIKVGAFYFDGWTGHNRYQLNSYLINNFPERKPIWGWETSTQDIVDKQIALAASSGISFFNFCWYYDGKDKDSIGSDDKNNALRLYLKSSNKKQLEFSLLVANHTGYDIKSSDWDYLTDYWCKLFKDESYVKVNGKPLITFFNMEGLVKTFGTTGAVNNALDRLRKKAVQNGCKGVTIAVCLSPSVGRVTMAQKCGYDLITNYNYHKQGFTSSLRLVMPVSSMKSAETKVWDTLRDQTPLLQIPAITLNWDQRPLEKGKINVSSRFTGFSQSSVRQSILSARQWIAANPNRTTKEKIVNVYAWNEYGEGSWLTPSQPLGNSLLIGLKEGLDADIQ
jgi:hypothetical protein